MAGRSAHAEPSALADVLTGRGARLTWTIAAMNAATMFAWWGLFSWIPSFLARPIDQGGAGLSLLRSSTWIVLMQVGMWLGYVSFGFIADRVGPQAHLRHVPDRRGRARPALRDVARSRRCCWCSGRIVAFFGTGYFSGFGAVTAEIFPTRIRATAQGLTYNLGRGISAAAPFTVGALATVYGLGAALLVTSLAFVLAAVLWIWIPETRGRALREECGAARA